MHDDTAAHFTALAGPKFNFRKTEIRSPLNCWWLVKNGLDSLGLRYVLHGDVTLPRPLEIAEVIEQKELRPLARDFLARTIYQRDGVREIGAWVGGGSLIWPTGCLAGSTEIVVNRGGAARRMKLDRVVKQFNGGEFYIKNKKRNYSWDLSIPTHTQSMTSDGFVRLNKIVAAVESGVKEVFLLKTSSGHEIEATAEHRFWTPNGWVRLRELTVGDVVYFADEPKANLETRKEKGYYLQIEQMWNHPFAVRVYGTRGNRAGGVSRTARVPLHRMEKEAEVNGISLEELVGRVILNRLGGLKFLDPGQVHVHHIDENTLNNARSNLEVLPISEHFAHHGREGGWKHVTASVKPATVMSIESTGEQMTYDLSMEAPDHNFVANGLVVHNSGKTLGGLAAALLKPGPILFITRGGARRQMQKEIYRFTSHEAVMLEGQGGDLPWGSGEPPRIIVTGWEILTYWIEALKMRMDWRIIADESHRVKKGSRWSASTLVETIAPGQKAKVDYSLKDNLSAAIFELSRSRAWWLNTTATPEANGRIDYWAQLDHADPDGFGTRRQFGFRYCGGEPTEYGGPHAWKPGKVTNTDEFNERLRWSAFNKISPEIVARDLPPKRRQVIYVPIAEQVKVTGFAKMLKDAQKSKDETKLAEAKLMLAAAKKRPAIVKAIGEYFESGAKVLLFSGRIADTEELFEQLQKKYPTVKGWCVTGQTGEREVQRAIAEYMGDETEGIPRHPGPCYLLGTGDKLGESLNLQDTDVSIDVMLPWTPKDLAQREGRSYRRGMLRNLLYLYFVAEGTYDEHVAETVLHKLASVESVLGETQLGSLGVALTGMEDEAGVDALLQSMVQKISKAKFSSYEDGDGEFV